MKHKALFKNKEFSPFSNVRKSKLYLSAKQICSILQKNGHESYFVGGAIRDLLIKPNAIPKDIDLTTSATPDDIFRLFQNTQFVGEAFGVSLVKINDMQFELTTFRKEGKYKDRRRPESISIGSFLDDANRRDFTMNCLYFDPIKNKILDPHLGLSDIKNKIIRCVGNANDRLYEDSLRILRMARFSANLHFTISNESLEAAKKQSDGISLLSKERILLEFQKVKLGRFYYFFEALNNILEINKIIFTNIKTEENNDQNLFYKNPLTIGKIKIETPYPFFNFLKVFLFSYNIELNNYQSIMNEIENWPLCNEYKKICFLFLKSITLKTNLSENTDIEVLDFIFFEYLSQINVITNNLSYGVLINLSIFIKDSMLKETLYKMIESNSKENNTKINTSEVIKYVEKENLDKKYISSIIKYLQYINLKKGVIPKVQSVIQFKNQFFKEYFNSLNSNILKQK